MKKSTLKIILFFAISAISFTVNAQTNNKLAPFSEVVKHTYYVDVRKVDTKTICLAIENNIAKKEGVISFKTVGFPSKYFVLKTNTVIKKADLELWLQENGVEMAFFGEGKGSLEELIYIKQKR